MPRLPFDVVGRVFGWHPPHTSAPDWPGVSGASCGTPSRGLSIRMCDSIDARWTEGVYFWCKLRASMRLAGQIRGGILVPLIQLKGIESTLNAEQKQAVIERLTDALLSVTGEHLRPVVVVVIEEVKSGAIGGSVADC